MTLDSLPTAAVADACVRLGLPLRVAPPGIRPAIPGSRASGRAAPVRHRGTVADLLAAIEEAAPGDILVVDNQGRRDEACIGDLLAIEAREAGLAAIVVWGLHRDVEEIAEIGLPVFSWGTLPVGPIEERELPDEVPRLGPVEVTGDDIVYADADGVVVVASEGADQVTETAREIMRRERDQARAARSGHSLRAQFAFRDYLERRSHDPSYTFRDHLREVGGAIET